jgi:hypothetical protein
VVGENPGCNDNHDNDKESTPSFPSNVTAPKGAPNVLLILMDDVGFGATSTFGGPIPTPTLDKLAAEGLRYNRFHTTAVCGPTRAALITGRNHHSAHAGVVTEMATGYPGYDSVLGKDMVTVAEILKDNGLPNSRASSTRAGTRCARRPLPARSSWASSRSMPS